MAIGGRICGLAVEFDDGRFRRRWVVGTEQDNTSLTHLGGSPPGCSVTAATCVLPRKSRTRSSQSMLALCYQTTRNPRKTGPLLPPARSSARRAARGQVHPQNARVRLLPPAHLFRGSSHAAPIVASVSWSTTLDPSSGALRSTASGHGALAALSNSCRPGSLLRAGRPLSAGSRSRPLCSNRTSSARHAGRGGSPLGRTQPKTLQISRATSSRVARGRSATMRWIRRHSRGPRGTPRNRTAEADSPY